MFHMATRSCPDEPTLSKRSLQDNTEVCQPLQEHTHSLAPCRKWPGARPPATHKRFISNTITGRLAKLPFSAASLMDLSTTRWATSAARTCST
jgi:hypothetical protein